MMKNRFQKRIYTVGISTLIFFLTQCTSSDTNTKKRLNPDSHPAISINYADNVSYERTDYPLINPEEILIDSLFIQVAYSLSSNRAILIARSIDDDEEGLKLLLIDPTDNNTLLYRSAGSFESMTLHPTYFTPDKKDQPTIITCSVGMYESWGQRLFFMNGDTINDISYLDVAAKIEADTSASEKGFVLKDIGPYTKVKMNTSGIHLSFQIDSLIYYGSKGEQIDPIIEASAINYTFINGVLRTDWKI